MTPKFVHQYLFQCCNTCHLYGMSPYAQTPAQIYLSLTHTHTHTHTHSSPLCLTVPPQNSTTSSGCSKSKIKDMMKCHKTVSHHIHNSIQQSDRKASSIFEKIPCFLAGILPTVFQLAGFRAGQKLVSQVEARCLTEISLCLLSYKAICTTLPRL